MFAPPAPIVEEALGQRGSLVLAARPAGGEPDDRIRSFGRSSQERTEFGEGGQAAGQARRVNPARVDGIARHSVLAPAPGPFVGEDDLGPLGPRVRRGAAVRMRRHLEAPEVKSLHVHSAGRHGHDVGVFGSPEQRPEETRQPEGCQHGGGQRELAAVGSAAVARKERSGRMHQHVHVVVDGGDPFGEGVHGARIDQVEHDGLNGPARTQAPGVACHGLRPVPVASEHPRRRAQARRLEGDRPADPRRGTRHDDHPPCQATRRAPVLQAGPDREANAAEAAYHTRLERGVHQTGQSAHPWTAHANR